MRRLSWLLPFLLFISTAWGQATNCSGGAQHCSTLTWTASPNPPAPAPPVSGYNVYRSLQTGGCAAVTAATCTKAGSTVSTVTTYTDQPLAASTTYFWVVTAFNSQGESGPSNEGTGTTTSGTTPTIPPVPASVFALAIDVQPPPPSNITFQQYVACPATVQNSASTITCAFSQPQSAGDLNVIAVGSGDSTSTVKSVTDSAGNVYALAIGPTYGISIGQTIYYAHNIKGGATTVTVTYNQAASFPDVRMAEYGGVSAVDQTVASTGTGTSATTPAVITTVAKELIFVSGTAGGCCSFTAAGPGFTLRGIDPLGSIVEDRTVSATGSYSGSATAGSAIPWVLQLVTFK